MSRYLIIPYMDQDIRNKVVPELTRFVIETDTETTSARSKQKITKQKL